MSTITTNAYPRALPFAPPQDLAAREARLRRWTYFLGAIAALTLLLLVTAGVFVANLLAQRPNAADAPAKGKELAAVQTQRDEFLQSLGVLSGAHLYQTYLNIGLLADGVEHRTYTKDEALAMLDPVTAMLDTVDQQLAKIKDAGLDPVDRKELEAIRSLSPLLREQVRTLRVYWKTGAKEDADRHQAARENTWTRLSETLGLKGE